MTKKVLIVAAVFWIASLFTGIFWGGSHRRLSPAEKRMESIKSLYEANFLEEALIECTQAEKDPACAEYMPQILYTRWVANARLSRFDESKVAGNQLLERFPNHVLAAEVHFASAMTLLAAGDVAAAESKLQMIEEKYPTTPLKTKIKDLHQRLARTIIPAPPRSPTTTAAH